MTRRGRFLILLAVALMQSGCLFDEDWKRRGPTVPAALDDGWTVATPESVGVDPNALTAIHENLLKPDRFVGALAFLVVKDHKLIFETYLRTLKDRDHVHHIQSVTKSVTSILYGIGRDQGWMPAPSTAVCSIMPDECVQLDPRKQGITLDDLMTMRSGLAFDNDDFSVEMWLGTPSDPIRYILDKPLYADPGTTFYYRDADPQLLGYAMQRVSGRSEEDLARQYLFEPLGIRDYYWDHGGHGESMAAHGLHLRPRDLAKIGQLMLDRGVWQGAPVVSAAWLDLSTTPKVDLPDAGAARQYGYYWWIVPEAGAYSAWGAGSQSIFVVPSQKLILVLLSMPNTDGDLVAAGNIDEFVALTRPLWQP